MSDVMKCCAIGFKTLSIDVIDWKYTVSHYQKYWIWYDSMTHNQIVFANCYVHASITVKWTLIENIQFIVTLSNNPKTSVS